MSDWGFWEWCAYGTLSLSIIANAIDELRKRWPDMSDRVPAFFNGPIWALLPLILLLIGTAIFVFRELGWVGKAKSPSVVFTDNASLRLHIFGDERTPQRLSFANIWRWYYLRQLVTGFDPSTGKETTLTATSILFVTFNPPVSIGTLEVSSPDIRLPRHEVKDFNPRSAVITFLAEVPAGTLEITVHR